MEVKIKMSEETVNNTIVPGWKVDKPVETQDQCDKYSEMAAAVNAHNAACKVGDVTWTIEDKPGCYEVAESGVVPEPEPAPPSLEEQLAALQSAQNDTDAMTVDQEYRLTLLELGVTDV